MGEPVAHFVKPGIGMARPRRTRQPHLIHHVMARGNGRMQIFDDERDYRHFVALLGVVLEEFEIKCWNYCLMPNHYHATLQPATPHLSEAIRHLNGGYAQWWNYRRKHVGHVFQGRFKDQIVQREGYLVSLCRYVARNPVRANLVSSPEAWQWSSYAATIGLRAAPGFLDVASTLEQFGPGDEGLLQSRFRAFVCGDPDEVMEERFRSNERMIGDQSFKKSLTTLVEPDPGVSPPQPVSYVMEV
jgi:REP element-mobilizing transposase RayT